MPPPGKFFLDTNVFVYSFDLDAPAKRRRAQALIAEALASGRGIISFQTVQEFLNVALRKFLNPLSEREAQTYLRDVLQPLLRVHSSATLYTEALALHHRYEFSWYDSLIVAAALEAQCDTIWTEDLQSGLRIQDLTIRNPF